LSLRATSLTRLRARDHYTSSTLIGGTAGAGPSSLHTTRDHRSMWMQDGCKIYMDSYLASNGSCFMVTWTIFKNHLLEVDLTQNQETKTLLTLTNRRFILFYHVWRPTWLEIHWNGIWLNITLFRSITVPFSKTNNILWNIPHIQIECEEHSAKYC
jgi:hypothetical protein